MKRSGTLAPVAAALTALTTLACCLPIGFAAAAATAGLSLVVAEYQSWFLGASLLLLGIGLFQLRQAHRTCAAHRNRSTVVFCVSAAIVLLVILFPQVIAGFVADWLP